MPLAYNNDILGFMADIERREGSLPTELLAQIDRMKQGGLISHAIGEPQRGMDGMIKQHLDRVALLEARGDRQPERPIYIFNPDSRLLINYAYRRHPNPDRTGLFANVVELDEKGRPRHGVSVVNPFKTSGGFVQVAVGENAHKFTPSFVKLEIDSEDPLKSVPPNIPTAELLAMLSTENIGTNETLEQFLTRTSEMRAKLRAATGIGQPAQSRGIIQALGTRTNPYVHLIISDRDVSQLANASRSVGLYPIVKSMDHIIEVYARQIKSGYKDPFNFGVLSWLSPDQLSAPELTPAFITYDYPRSSEIDPNDPTQKRKIELPGPPEAPHYRKLIRIEATNRILNGLIENNPVFALLENPGADFPDESSMSEEDMKYNYAVDKIAHGSYLQPLNPGSDISLQNYTDWLRKARLDFALTLYLRGLSEI